MKIWKLKVFVREARKAGVDDKALEQAAREAAEGTHEAKLSACIAKKRVARKASGKRGGFRTIVAFQDGPESPIIFLEV